MGSSKCHIRGMYGKVLIAGGYLALLPQYQVIVLKADCTIECRQKALEPTVHNRFERACVEVVQEYMALNQCTYNICHWHTTASPSFYTNGKTGLGSSSAFTAACMQCILKAQGIMNKDLVFKLALEAHNRAQGKVGSGFDVAAAVYGSILYSRMPYKSMQDLIQLPIHDHILPFQWPSAWSILLFQQDCGTLSPGRAKSFLRWHASTYDHSILDAISNDIKSIKQACETLDPVLLKDTMVDMLHHYHTLGTLCDIDIIPNDYLSLFKDILLDNEVLGVHCPGAGGHDAFCIISTSPAVTVAKMKERGLTHIHVLIA